MKALVWALYLMVQDPGTDLSGTGAGANGQQPQSQSWAFTGVTYLKKASCVSDAATFNTMPTGSKSDGLPATSNISYVCVLQPKPEHYKN